VVETSPTLNELAAARDEQLQRDEDMTSRHPHLTVVVAISVASLRRRGSTDGANAASNDHNVVNRAARYLAASLCRGPRW
jgi:hypothetical protein